MSYLTRRWIQLALRWLRKGAATIRENALCLGYMSEATFSHAFKRGIGVSPGSIRDDRDAGRRQMLIRRA